MRAAIPFLLCLTLSPQVLAGDAAAGKVVAIAICSSCHSIGLNDPGPAAPERRGPDFIAMAARPDLTREGIELFLKTTHARRDAPIGMPNPNLTRDQVSDVLTYLISLQNAPVDH